MYARIVTLLALLGPACADDIDAPDPDAGADVDLPVDPRLDPDRTPDSDPDPDPPPPVAPLINEYVINIEGSDTHEYIEVRAGAGATLSHLTLLQIESSIHQNPGQIDMVFALDEADGEGYWFTGYQNAVFQNTSLTLILVEDFTGQAGDDLDTDDDGVFDDPPWGVVADSLSIDDGGGGDVFHSPVVLGPSIQVIGGASRMADTGDPSDWVFNNLDGAGLPCTPCTAATAVSGEAMNTPAQTNWVVE